MDGIVMDLRGNGGGSLYDVVQMVGLFIEDGPVCQVKGRGEKAKILDDRDKAVKYTGPLTVLVDETSASASEIFAAAIQDYKRGIVIGSTSTYGKGTVSAQHSFKPSKGKQFVWHLAKSDDLGTVKLTLQKFYRINGGATQLEGVVPDVILPDRLEYIKFREKDNPDALKWDKISEAPYKTWTSTFSTDAIIKQANATVSTNPNFEKIKENVQWLEKNNNRSYSLNLEQFKEDQKELKNAFKKIEEAYKLAKPMQIQYLSADVNKSALVSKDREERDKQWLKVRGDDIYINKSVEIINSMINQANLVKAN